MTSPTVGVVANPASGRDIRRLVSGASVFDNAEKGSMVFRLMAGLGAAGVDRVLMMPAPSGVFSSLQRQLRSRTGELRKRPFPALEVIEMPLRQTADDTVEAVAAMVDERVAVIVVLGGDGTHRIVAKGCGDTPLCTLSTGTNNVFPEVREATLAGLAAGLVASGRVRAPGALRREKLLRVGLNGDAGSDCALVDVAVSRNRWTGARALWQVEEISEVAVTVASPSAVGLSALAGLLDPAPRRASHGLYVKLVDPAALGGSASARAARSPSRPCPSLPPGRT